MNPAEAKKLKIGTRVKWESSNELGKIAEKGEAGIRVQWDDGTNAVYLYAVTHAGLLHVKKVE